MAFFIPKRSLSDYNQAKFRVLHHKVGTAHTWSLQWLARLVFGLTAQVLQPITSS